MTTYEPWGLVACADLYRHDTRADRRRELLVWWGLNGRMVNTLGVPAVAIMVNAASVVLGIAVAKWLSII